MSENVPSAAILADDDRYRAEIMDIMKCSKKEVDAHLAVSYYELWSYVRCWRVWPGRSTNQEQIEGAFQDGFDDGDMLKNCNPYNRKIQPELYKAYEDGNRLGNPLRF